MVGLVQVAVPHTARSIVSVHDAKGGVRAFHHNECPGVYCIGPRLTLARVAHSCHLTAGAAGDKVTAGADIRGGDLISLPSTDTAAGRKSCLGSL